MLFFLRRTSCGGGQVGLAGGRGGGQGRALRGRAGGGGGVGGAGRGAANKTSVERWAAAAGGPKPPRTHLFYICPNGSAKSSACSSSAGQALTTPHAAAHGRAPV